MKQEQILSVLFLVALGLLVGGINHNRFISGFCAGMLTCFGITALVWIIKKRGQ